MQMLHRLGFMLLLCALFAPAQARVMPDLYEVVEAVASRGNTDRAAASSRGLERVFVRVTGDADIGSNPQLTPVLQKASQYLQGYRYASENNQLYLHLTFEPQAVGEIVHKLQLPIWPNNRPGTLVWMAVDTLQGGRTGLKQQDYPELFAVLDSLALERGLPLEFPVMDLNDQRNMRTRGGNGRCALPAGCHADGPPAGSLRPALAGKLAADSRRPELRLRRQWQLHGRSRAARH
jgi:hypothetical protein